MVIAGGLRAGVALRRSGMPASTEPAMVIAGGRRAAGRGRPSATCFNGAGDGDRRRGRTARCLQARPARRFNGAGDGDRRRGREKVPTLRSLYQCFNGAGDGDRRRGNALSGSMRTGGGFNGAGDGDRRREQRAREVGHRERLASTEPAMVIAGGPVRRLALERSRQRLQRSRRW